MPIVPATMEAHADLERAQHRRFARVPFDCRVRLTRLATGQSLELDAVNLSEGGIFVQTVIPFPVGELFRVAVLDERAPEDFAEVAAARVAWRRPFTNTREPGEPPGIGIAFLLMSPDDREGLSRIVEDGGLAPRARPIAAPVAPIAVEEPVLPALVDGAEAIELDDVGPFGWLLVIALALAALASLLLGMHPG